MVTFEKRTIPPIF